MPTERLTIKAIAERTGADAKRIRAWLRKEHARQAEAKGSRWGTAKEAYALPAAVTAAALARFTPKAEETEAA